MDNRLLLALMLSQLALHSSMAGLRLAIPLQALRAGHTEWAVGLLLALFTVLPALSSMATGRWVDRRGYHLPLQLAVALSVGGAAIALVTHVFPDTWLFALLCFAAVMSGAGANVCAILTQHTGGLMTADTSTRLRVFSWLGMSPALANAIGPVLVGFLIDGAGFHWAYGALAVLPLLSLWIARRMPTLLRHNATSVERVSNNIRSLLAVPGLKRLLFINWVLSASWDMHSFAVPILGFARHYSASTIGIILSVFTFGVTLVRFAIPLFSHRVDEARLLWTAMILVGVIFLVYPFAETPWLMGVCAGLLGLTLGAVQPTVVSAIYQLSPAGREGEAIALRTMAISVSNSFMPLIFGAVSSSIGLSTVFWIMGAAVGSGSWVIRGVRSAIKNSTGSK